MPTGNGMFLQYRNIDNIHHSISMGIVAHVCTNLIANAVMTVDRPDCFSVKEQNIVLLKIQKMLEHLGELEEPVSNSTFFEWIYPQKGR
jgi:hypothetical protein